MLFFDPVPLILLIFLSLSVVRTTVRKLKKCVVSKFFHYKDEVLVFISTRVRSQKKGQVSKTILLFGDNTTFESSIVA